MYDPNKGFDPFEFIFGEANTSPWNSSYFYDFIKDTITKSLNNPLRVTPPWDFSNLNDYIQDTISQSVNRQMGLFMNQRGNTNPKPPVIKEQANDLSRSSPSEELSAKELPSDELASEELSPIEPIPDIDRTLEEPPEAQFYDVEAPDSDSRSDTDEPDLKEQAVYPKPQSYSINIGIHPEVVQTHNMVIIKVNLPEGIDENDLRISVSDGHAKIKWPSGYVEHIVPLPEDIIGSSASAVIKDRILEIHIPRRHEGDLRRINI